MKTSLPLIGLLAMPAACSGPAGGAPVPAGPLAVGALAPDLAAVDQNGTTRRLAAMRGGWVVVYFFPKEGTPGCTTEACAFRDVWDRYRAAGVEILGVSLDDAAAEARFGREHAVPFPLLGDPQGGWARAFGVPVHSGYAQRMTFLIDPAGRIARVYEHVDPGVHATQVLDDLAALRR